MIGYILKRCALMIPTLIGVLTVFFLISEFVPGGPYDRVIAMIRGTERGQGGEAATGAGFRGGSERAGAITVTQREEQRIKRVFGLNRSRGERYLRSILWFGRDSLTSSLEIEENNSLRFTREGQRYFAIRRGSDTAPVFDIFYNTIVRLENTEKYYRYDHKKQRVIPLDPCDSAFAVKPDPHGVPVGFVLEELGWSARDTQMLLGRLAFTPEGIGITDSALTLPKRECEAVYEVVNDLTILPDGTRQRIDLPRYEVYFKQGRWEALTDPANWHGYFLLKFPDSIDYKKPAYEVIAAKLPVSVRLGVISFFLVYLISITLGIAKAVRNGSTFDTASSMTILIGYSIPGFVLAVFLLKCFGPNEPLLAHIIPLGGLHSVGAAYDAMGFWGKLWDNIQHLIAPVICLSIGSFASLTFLTKNSVLEQTNRLYAVAARARGLSERKVLFKHILRNALIPLVTGFPTAFLMMFFGGSVLIEKIFNLDGIGLLGYTALTNSDFPLMMSNLFVFTLIGLIGRLLADILYVIIDPRISYGGNRQ